MEMSVPARENEVGDLYTGSLKAKLLEVGTGRRW
jgi:hypothetical protein